MSKFFERAGDGTWAGDLAEILEPLFGGTKVASWLKWVSLVVALTAALVVGVLLIVNSSSQGTPTPSETTASASPTPEPTATPTETPAPPSIAESALKTIPGNWAPANLAGCTQSWTSDTERISSVLVLGKAQEAFKAAGFTTDSTWGESSLTVKASGNQNGISSAELDFKVGEMTLCLR